MVSQNTQTQNSKKTPSETDTTMVVVGGGIVGLSTALYLQRAGLNTLLIESRHIGAGASFGNACMLTNTSIIPVATPGLTKKIPYYLFNGDSPLRLTLLHLIKQLGWFGQFWWGANIRDLHHRAEALNLLLCDAYAQHKALAKGTPAEQFLAPCSTLTPFVSEHSRQADSTLWDIRKQLCSGISTLDDDDLRQDMPALGKIWTKSYVAGDYGKVLSAQKYLQALADEFTNLGGTTIQSAVHGFDIQGGQVTGVITNNGVIQGDKIALCAGVYSGKLSQQLGDKVPLVAESGYHMEIRNVNVTIKHSILSSAHGMAVTDLGDNTIRCTIFAEYAGLNAPPNYQDAERMIRKNLKSLLPDLQIADYTLWRGDRPSTSDSLPIIGPASRYNRVFYGFGHQHIGMSSGAKTGKILMELMTGKQPCIDITAFDVKRFA